MKPHAWIYNVVAGAVIFIYGGSFLTVLLAPFFGYGQSVDQLVKDMAKNAPEALLALMIRWPGADRRGDDVQPVEIAGQTKAVETKEVDDVEKAPTL